MEAGSPKCAAVGLRAWENTQNFGINWGSIQGSIFSAARAEQGRRDPPPKVNLTLSWWNTAVISLPVTVRWLCQAALTMAVN